MGPFAVPSYRKLFATHVVNVLAKESDGGCALRRKGKRLVRIEGWRGWLFRRRRRERTSFQIDWSMTMSYWQLTGTPTLDLWFETSKYETLHPILHIVLPCYVMSSWVIHTSFNLVPLSTIPQLYAAPYPLVFSSPVELIATGLVIMGPDLLPEELLVVHLFA
jgi:hypothetical protein